jgi:plastocyanin
MYPGFMRNGQLLLVLPILACGSSTMMGGGNDMSAGAGDMAMSVGGDMAKSAVGDMAMNVGGDMAMGGFMALAPCNSAADYKSGTTTITFGGAAGLAYSPQCLSVARGTTVTFSGSFSSHPLSASTRGTSGNPIPKTSTGTSATVTFNAAGFFPYFCTVHGSDSGAGMAGVVQVTP